MDLITLSPIAIIRNDRKIIEDDNWGKSISVIELLDPLTEEALNSIEEFSHAEVIFVFDRVSEDNTESGTRHLCINKNWPRVGCAMLLDDFISVNPHYFL